MATRTNSSTAMPVGRKRPGGLEEVSRKIKPAVERILWGRSAARCEFSGCNKPLWKSSVTQESVNIAQKAHIYAFSEHGARGNRGVPTSALNNFENLMLVCHECHQKIDKDKDGGRYSAGLLRQWKAEHERRIEIVTGVDPSKKSHVLLYGANIGDHGSPLNFAEAAHAMFPRSYPADDKLIRLGMVNSAFVDRNPKYWDVEREHLTRWFNVRVKERVVLGEVSHLSVFALAPQPLLILLGTLMIDITNAEVFQRHREPQTWTWPSKGRPLKFEIQEPPSFKGPPALALGLSASITDDRVIRVLGGDAAIWRVGVANPHNDLFKSRGHLSTFRATIRPLLDRIKAQHGQTTTLHVFPAMGVAPAVELGRVRMPKAHMPWMIYDQVNSLGGFIPAFSIP
jgi:hypothetical protein